MFFSQTENLTECHHVSEGRRLSHHHHIAPHIAKPTHPTVLKDKRRNTMGMSHGLVLCLSATLLDKGLTFTARAALVRSVPRRLIGSTIIILRDAGLVEKPLMGEERYEMLPPLPDSMVSKTLSVNPLNQLRRISRDDVERLSRGQPAKSRGYGSRNVPHRLNEEEREEMDRASSRKGYITVAGTGYRRERKGSPLTNIHRQWCDAREKPQVILCKASSSGGGGSPAAALLDDVIVDLSPLRLHGLVDDAVQVEDLLGKWKAQILTVAEGTGMALREANVQDTPTTTTLEQMEGLEDNNDDDDDDDDDVRESVRTDYTATVDVEAWATLPIWRLPVVSMGVFEGERSKAKAMAGELAKLWEIPDIHMEGARSGPQSRRSAGARNGGKTKVKGLSNHRRGGGSSNNDGW
jgi:hypothetical protein